MVTFFKNYGAEHAVLIHTFAYEGGEEFLEKANLAELDVVFLDVYMNALSGMDVAKRLRAAGCNCRIVFVTSTESFAVESYDVRAFGYLVKPVCDEKLAAVVALIEADTRGASRFMVVKVGREIKKVVLSEIVYIDYHNHYVQIHTQREIVSTYKKFAEFEKELLKYGTFMTCYRCTLILGAVYMVISVITTLNQLFQQGFTAFAIISLIMGVLLPALFCYGAKLNQK